MINRVLTLAIVSAAVLTQTSCKGQNGYKTTENGLEYKIVTDSPSTQKPGIGDIVEMHIRSAVGDSVLFDSRKINNNQPVPFNIQAAQFKGDLVEGFMMMTAGDSAQFRVPLDSLLKLGAQPLPWMKQGEGMKLDYTVKMVTVRTRAQMEQVQKDAAAKQISIDDRKIQDYLTANKIKATKTPTGLYYKLTAPGAGVAAKAGQEVTVNYTGMLLDGTKFDSNVDPQFNHVQPFKFMVGQGQVIKGWDQAAALMKKGGKGTFYVPSTLAYGPNSPGPQIPANAVLIFDIEVKEITGAGTAPAVTPAPKAAVKPAAKPAVKKK